MNAVVQQRLTEMWESPHIVRGWFATVDHKTVGKRYLAAAFIFLLIGGVEALIMRLQLSRANEALITPEMYDQLFTMHGMTMIYWYAAPVLSGFRSGQFSCRKKSTLCWHLWNREIST